MYVYSCSRGEEEIIRCEESILKEKGARRTCACFSYTVELALTTYSMRCARNRPGDNFGGCLMYIHTNISYPSSNRCECSGFAQAGPMVPMQCGRHGGLLKQQCCHSILVVYLISTSRARTAFRPLLTSDGTPSALSAVTAMTDWLHPMKGHLIGRSALRFAEVGRTRQPPSPQ